MDLSYKKSCMAFGVLAVLVVVSMCSRYDHLFQGRYLSSRQLAFSEDHATNRKLLDSPAGYDDDVGNGVDYAGDSDGNGNYGNGNGNGDNNGDGDGDDDDGGRINIQCSKDNIYICQGPTSPLPSGIPTYSVQIQNICMPGSCSFSNVHLSCGWFGSARFINPNVFKRLSYDDCLVNNGDPITPGQMIDFQYANTYAYPLSVSSATMLC